MDSDLVVYLSAPTYWTVFIMFYCDVCFYVGNNILNFGILSDNMSYFNNKINNKYNNNNRINKK